MTSTTQTLAPTRRSLTTPATLIRAGALISVATAVATGTGLLAPIETTYWTPAGFAFWTIVDLLSTLMMLTGLAGLARSGALGNGPLTYIGIALATLGLFAATSVLSFTIPDAGERLHPVSVPLAAIGMLITGIAVLRTRTWHGWRRFALLLYGVFPFVVELPGFIFFGDTTALSFFIAGTWACWLVLATAAWLERSEQ